MSGKPGGASGVATETPQRWLTGVLIALAILPYANALQAGFVYDDAGLVVKHETVQGPFSLASLLTTPYWGAERAMDTALWRPLTSLSFGVDDAVRDDSAAWMHGVNVGLHAAVVVLGFLLAQHLGATRQAAAAAAALFAVHPLHTEAVTWISGRAELLAALGAMGALLAATPCTPRRALACGVATFAAVGSKESSAFLPVAVLALALSQGEPLRRAARAAGASLAAVLVFVALRFEVLGTLGGPVSKATENPMVGTHLLERVPTLLDITGRYVALVLWPHPLSIDYSPPAVGLAEGWTGYGALGLLASLALLALALARPTSVLGRAALLAVASYAVASNIVIVIGTHLAERLFYLPSYGLLLLAACLAARSALPARWLAAGLIVLLGAGATLTWHRNRDYRDDLTLAEATLRHFPNAPKASYNRARELQRRGAHAEALAQARHTLTLRHDDGWARIVRTNALVSLGRSEEAEAALRNDLAEDPRGHLERARLLELLDARGAPNEADQLVEEALALGASRPPWPARGAYAAQQRGDFALATQRWRHVVEVAPDAAYAWTELGRSLLAGGDPASARDAFEQGLRLDPWDPETANALAWTLLQTGGDAGRAVTLAELAVGTQPRPDFLDTQARALAAVGRCADALDRARQAAAGDTDYLETVDEIERTCSEAAPPATGGASPNDS